MQKINKTKNKEGGFTLVELMVATTIFVVIVISSIGSLLVLLGASKDSRGLRFAMDNVNFAMESMTRSIRMGVNYYCNAETPDDPDAYLDCPGGGTIISFVPKANTSTDRVTYKLVERNGPEDLTIRRCTGITESSCVDIVSSDVNINVLRFYVTGADPLDPFQAKVYILLKGTIDVKGKKSPFMIQTLASQRNY